MLIDYPNLNKVFSSIDECHTLTEKQALQLLQVGGTDMSAYLDVTLYSMFGPCESM